MLHRPLQVLQHSIRQRYHNSLTVTMSSPKSSSFLLSTTNDSARTAQRRVDILSNWVGGKLHMSTVSGSTTTLEETQGKVICKKQLSSRALILNNPKKLNALDTDMVEIMIPQLQAWDKSDLAKIIIIKSAGGKGFCAGGDVRNVAELNKEKNPSALKFFEKEYQLNHLIATVKTPLVALMDGITMGGGAGISVHAPFHIATERTVFAMPETAIGLFPDVGGSFFLPRLDGHLGTYLALTGHKLSGRDVFYAGLATHYVPSSRLPALEDRLSELETSDLKIINNTIEEHAGEFDGDEAAVGPIVGGEIRNTIDRIFSRNKIDEIFELLKIESSNQNTSSEVQAWAQESYNILQTMSPTSLRATLRQLRYGAKLGIADCLRMEFKMAQQALGGSDFNEGVTAKLVERRTPKWSADIDDAQIDKLWFKENNKKELQLFSTENFTEYPNRFGLPSEDDVRAFVNKNDAGRGPNSQRVLNYFLESKRGKAGVQERVLEILKRRTIEDKNDVLKSLKWQ